MLSNDGFALLIGVDDYSSFDASRRQPLGTTDLPGSRNDARAFWRLCRRVGIEAANIRVLTSPPIDFHELPGAGPENVAPATEAEILAKTAWLAEHLAAPRDGGDRPTGLFTYSGHGDWLPGKGLVLCPADVAATGDADLVHAVPFHALNELLGRGVAAENLTVVLDTCHSGAVGAAGAGDRLTHRRLGSLTGRAPAGHVPALEQLAGRVLVGARPDQVAYQAVVDGQFRGVFSWALTVAMEQWRVTPEGSGVRLDVSYGKLVETARRVLSALWFEQTPELHGPAGLADLAVFHACREGCLAGHPGDTTVVPNGVFKAAELDPGVDNYLIYTITQGGTQIGQVLVTSTEGGGYGAATEYWYMTAGISSRSAVTITPGTSQSWTTPPSGLGTLSFKMANSTSWTRATRSGNIMTYSNLTTGEYEGMVWGMTETAGVWSGTITWWSLASTGTLFQPGVARSLSPVASSGTAYYITNSPI